MIYLSYYYIVNIFISLERASIKHHLTDAIMMFNLAYLACNSLYNNYLNSP